MVKSSGWNIKERFLLLGIILIIFIIINVFSLLFDDLFNVWNFKVNDQLFHLRYEIKGKEKLNPNVIHVDLNDSTIQNLQISVFDRSIYAKVIDVLSQAGVRGMVFDIFFAEERNKAQDESLVRATKDAGMVFYAVVPQPEEYRQIYEGSQIDLESEELLEKFLWHPKVMKKGNPPSAGLILTNFNKLTEAAAGIGNISTDPDEDGVFRKINLIYGYKGGFIPSLTLGMFCNYLEINPDEIEVYFGKYLILKNAKFPIGYSKDIKIPIDSKGRTIVNFAGLSNDTFLHLSFEGILDIQNDTEKMNELRDTIEDSLIIISDVSTHGKDHGTVPLEKVYPLSGIHANFLNSVLTENFIKPLGPLEVLLIQLVFVLLIWFIAMHFKAVKFALFSVIGFLVILALNILLFVYFNRLPLLIPLTISFIITLIAVILFQYFLDQKKYIAYILELNKATTRFVPQEFLQNLLKESITKIFLGDQVQKEMSVLFSDIRSFTSISEKMSPKENFDFINSYLSKMGPIIRENGGFIDKYIGDAIMALFPKTPDDAVSAGIAMHKTLEEYNKEQKKEGKIPVKIGVGINLGNLMLGIIGEKERFEGTVISDAVNLASRLEGLTKHYGAGIIVSEEVLNKTKNKDVYTYRFLDYVQVKGKKAPVSLYEILDGLDEPSKKLKSESTPLYEEAFNLYLKKDFKKASSLFKKVLDKNPDDLAAKMFISRIVNLMKYGVPEAWDGAVEFTEK